MRRRKIFGPDASSWEQRKASRGVEGGGNERPLVAGMDAQRNLCRMLAASYNTQLHEGKTLQ